MTHADLIESKSLAGLTSASSSEGFPKLAAAPREGHIGSGGAVLRRPPSWMEHVPFSDWEIDVADVVIGLRPDGRKWELGAGAFSKVRGCNRLAYTQCLVSGEGDGFGVVSCFMAECYMVEWQFGTVTLTLFLPGPMQHLQHKSHEHTNPFTVAADEVQHVLPIAKAGMVFAFDDPMQCWFDASVLAWPGNYSLAIFIIYILNYPAALPGVEFCWTPSSGAT